MAEVKQIFHGIDKALKEKPSRTKGVEAIYQFDLDGNEGGTYQLILKSDGGYSVEGEQETPDCTLKMRTNDFEKLANGQLNGTQAFMTGRLKVKGNVGLALKLQGILSAYNTANQ
ncbi:sterol-binding protein [Virgibacillus phasianinus]|uniref:Sterol-binding protein n=1 Tax=Virgibacillus phasianinus TaxID=2017483 RepID=A0A220U3P1_9BACI|nr:SCP2 sterol-binding domain-containing protein [Virgibacillus phasianinus]ASK62675.1 sterol-binding protein [Virgibacillus phasianinus]